MSPKHIYEEQVKYQLEDWKLKINAIKLRAAKSPDRAKVDSYEVVEDLQDKQGKACDRMRELNSAGARDWEEAKIVLEEAFFRLGGAINAAAKRFP